MHMDKEHPDEAEEVAETHEYRMFNRAREGPESVRDRYPVELTRVLTPRMKDQIMSFVKEYNTSGPTPPHCNTFCAHLKLWELKNLKKYKIANTPRDVICTMILASLGGQEVGNNRSRAVQPVDFLLGPLVTDAYVGVCCKSLQKLCQSVKRNLLEEKSKNKKDTPFRDIAYDGWVQPRYSGYPFNGAVCENITRAEWDPPINVVERWVDICMAQMWEQPKRPKVICLKVLRLDVGPQAIDQLKSYVDDARGRIWAIANKEEVRP